MKSWRSLIDWLRPPRDTRRPGAEANETAIEGGGWPLRLRFLVIVLIALAPVAALSVVQGMDRFRRDEEDIRERLIQTARASASEEENMLAAAEQILRALSNEPDVRAGKAGCNKMLSDALSGLSFFTNIVRINADGRVTCSALAGGKNLDVRALPWWQEAANQDGFVVSRQLYGVLSKRNVVFGLLPLRAGDGRFDGALAIGLDTQWLEHVLRAKNLPEGAVVGIFDRAGSIIATNNTRVAAALFGGKTHPRRVSNRLLSGTGPLGKTWLYVTAPLLGDQILVGFAMLQSELFVWTYIHVAADFVLPIVMLALAWLAIGIATDRQVIRWIVYMRRIAVAYAHGYYAIRPVALEDAPSEFRELGATLSGMAEAIQDRDKRLRDAVAQKTMLLREIHHRIKNNLQIVMSLLNLQSGRLRDSAAQEALRQAQVRVNALALVHNILHEIEEQSSVDLQRLLTDLVAQLHGGLAGDQRDLRIEINIVPRRISGDIAVPLTLLSVEALTNVFKHAYPPDSRGGIVHVDLLPDGQGRLRLTIADDGVGLNGDEESLQSGIGSRLIQAFAEQIGGTVSIKAREGGGTIVELLFPEPSGEMTAAAGEARSGA